MNKFIAYSQSSLPVLPVVLILGCQVTILMHSYACIMYGKAYKRFLILFVFIRVFIYSILMSFNF